MRKEQFTKLQECFGQKLKYRELKKDPLLIAFYQLDSGGIYFEYVENTDFPWGAFLVVTLGAVNTLPTRETPFSRDLESLYISFGFHSEPTELVSQIIDFLGSINAISIERRV